MGLVQQYFVTAHLPYDVNHVGCVRLATQVEVLELGAHSLVALILLMCRALVRDLLADDG